MTTTDTLTLKLPAGCVLFACNGLAVEREATADEVDAFLSRKVQPDAWVRLERGQRLLAECAIRDAVVGGRLFVTLYPGATGDHASQVFSITGMLPD